MTSSTDGEAALMRRVADKLRDHRFQGWFYGDSVGFEGLLAASELLGDPTYRDFSRGFFRGWATRIEPFRPDDNTAAGHAICTVIGQTGDALLLEAALKLADHLVSRRRISGIGVTFEDTRRSVREPYGDVQLSVADQALMRDPGAGIYLDCMHFDPPFFAHLGKLGQGQGWSDRAVQEILGYADLLLDAETGLYCHFWLEKTGRAYTKGWGRGQGWALLGLLDVAEHADPHTPGYDVVVERLRQLADRMLDWQQPDGNWFALVHEPRSGAESSTAAFMAGAFYRGIRLGLLDAGSFRPAADRAYAAMLAKLAPNGDLQGVSAAVYSALVEEHYWYVPTGFIVPWGQGPVLTAALARRQLLGG